MITDPKKPCDLESSPKLSSSQMSALRRFLDAAPYRYPVAIALAVAAIVLRLTFLKILGSCATYVTFYPAVMLAALYGGVGPGLVAAAVSALLADYFVNAPQGIFLRNSPADWLAMVIFLSGCSMISCITEAMRRARKRVIESENEIRLAAERASSMEAKHASELQYRLLFDTNPNPMWVFDEETFDFLTVNEAALQHYGYSREEFLGMTIKDIRPADDVERLEYFIPRQSGSVCGDAGVWQHRKKDGTLIYVQITYSSLPFNNRPGRLVLIHDITQRKQSEETQLKYTLLAGNSRDIILFVRREDGQVLEANQSAVKAYGFNHAELLEMKVQQLRAEVNGELTERQMADADSQGVLFETLHRRKDGSTFPVEVSSRGADLGDTRILVSVIRDITRRKQAEKELRQAHEELELRVIERTQQLEDAIDNLLEETQARIKAAETLREQERMLIQQSRQAAMGEMIGNIAHQWRQPLNTLALFTQRIGFFYGSDRFDKQFLDDSITKSMEIIHYMSRTIDDFRNFFSPDREKTYFRVAETIGKALSLVESSFKERQIQVERLFHQDDVTIHGYQNEFAQVLLNIFINVRDIVNERHITSPRLIISVSKENDVSVVTITDNAGGIPDEIIERIFEPYFTTKGPQQGTGVGLYMSKIMIEKNMGGKITARNTGEGAEFRIEV